MEFHLYWPARVEAGECSEPTVKRDKEVFEHALCV